MSLAEWPRAERPRERLLAQGPQALSDAELIALFLGTGVRGASALQVARALLARFGRVSRLLGAARGEMDVAGVGEARYAQIAAVMELARRALAEESAAAVRDLAAQARGRARAASQSASEVSR